jgi:hypothetical protein
MKNEKQKSKSSEDVPCYFLLLTSLYFSLLTFFLPWQDKRQSFDETCIGEHPIHNALFAFGICLDLQYQTEQRDISRLRQCALQAFNCLWTVILEKYNVAILCCLGHFLILN